MDSRLGEPEGKVDVCIRSVSVCSSALHTCTAVSLQHLVTLRQNFIKVAMSTNLFSLIGQIWFTQY